MIDLDKFGWYNPNIDYTPEEMREAHDDWARHIALQSDGIRVTNPMRGHFLDFKNDSESPKSNYNRKVLLLL